MYDYGGYNNVCFFAGEVSQPEKVIPRSILISISLVAVLYSDHEYLDHRCRYRGAKQCIRPSSCRTSDENLRLPIAQIMTGLILFTTFASLFAVSAGLFERSLCSGDRGAILQNFSGGFIPPKNFPYFSVAFIGIASAFASMLNLADLITALIVIQVLVQFMAQVVAVTLIRRYRPDIQRPFKMWLYPVTSIIAFCGWAFILAASGLKFILWGVALIAFGVISYMWKARVEGQWPFNGTALEATP